jgi:hypothetical protein
MPDVPNICGAWTRSSDGIQMVIDQVFHDPVIYSEFESPSHRQTLTGAFNPASNQFNYKVIRVNKEDTSKQTEMTGIIDVITDLQIRTSITGTDGQDDLPSNFKEVSIWNCPMKAQVSN